MISKINNSAITHQALPDVITISEQEIENQAMTDFRPNATKQSMKSSEVSDSIASQAKGLLNMEANVRQFSVERDLDQPDMATAKTYQSQSDQDIVSAIVKNAERKIF